MQVISLENKVKDPGTILSCIKTRTGEYERSIISTCSCTSKDEILLKRMDIYLLGD